jgi:transcriptional regulator with XRE-family HTH domain
MMKSVDPTPTNTILPQVLRAARREAGLRQADLARRLQKPQSFVSKIETGERSLNVVEFAIVAQAIGADPLTLFATVLERLMPDAGL